MFVMIIIKRQMVEVTLRPEVGPLHKYFDRHYILRAKTVQVERYQNVCIFILNNDLCPPIDI